MCDPAVANVCVGDCRESVAPSSKTQSQDVACGELVSVKVTGAPARGEPETEKFAMGGVTRSEIVSLCAVPPACSGEQLKARTNAVIGSRRSPRGSRIAPVDKVDTSGSPLMRTP